MDLRDGRVHGAVVRPVNADKRFVVTSGRVSDRWLAWEELSQGDDLAYPAKWRLYAAPLNEGRLAIGKPALVAAGDAGPGLTPAVRPAGRPARVADQHEAVGRRARHRASA